MNTQRLVIGTHNGLFHHDEITAISLISILHENNIVVIRSRDIKLLSKCSMLIDVGFGEFDHHMVGGNGVRTNGNLYASCGLIWKRFGEEILEKLGCPLNLINECFFKIDKNLIEPIDKIDNGIKSESLLDFIPYFIPNSNMISHMDYAFDEVLKIVTSIVKKIIVKEIENCKEDILIEECIRSRKKSFMLLLPSPTIEWKEKIILYNILNPGDEIDFVIFPYQDGGYAAQSVPPSIEEVFNQRISFPKKWAGQTKKLSVISNVNTATFCHNNLFFVRAEIKEDIMKMCEIAKNN